jgi:acetyltransferase-like isoleucine patch superfamily enzyme
MPGICKRNHTKGALICRSFPKISESTEVEVGDYSHVASGCSVAGGKDYRFKLGDFCSLSSGVKIWCGSDDFVNDVVALLPDEAGKGIKNNFIHGDVIIDDFAAVGANAVVMPKNHIPEGTTIGALSFVPPGFKFKPWSVYAGVPVCYIKPRNKANVLRQVAMFKKRVKNLNKGKSL